MADPVDLADVLYRGERIGTVFWDRVKRHGVFQYEPDFIALGKELAPVHMPLRPRPYAFPRLDESFGGLPGFLADVLPDTFGNALIDDWLRTQGRRPEDFSPVERLCYLGSRAMGALEFKPSLRQEPGRPRPVHVEKLVELAAASLRRKEGLDSRLEDEEGLNDILRVGTSAGGARAKAVIAWNPLTNEVRSGQAAVPDGFEHWLLKFDGVEAAFDGVRDPRGYGRIEYAYHRMAQEAGVHMMPCRLLEENGRAHFMTRRFDRDEKGGKIHYASLFGLGHMPYAPPSVHGHAYEQVFELMEKIGIDPAGREQMFLRAAFNVLACNRDDHVKNFGFLFTHEERWTLSPAFDVTYAHNPAPGKWTATQQMSVCGKRENITAADLIQLGRTCAVGTFPRIKALLKQVHSAIQNWTTQAEAAGVDEANAAKIGAVLRRASDGKQ